MNEKDEHSEQPEMAGRNRVGALDCSTGEVLCQNKQNGYRPQKIQIGR